MHSFFKVTKFLRALYPLLSQGHKLDHQTLIEKSIHLRTLLQELGPTYIKLGQMLSVRFDLLHNLTCNELQVLLDSGEPIDFEYVKTVIEEELGEKSFEILKMIDKKPYAVASLGQVHVGFINGNQKVAIKIQKPGSEKQIREDLHVLKNVISLTSFIPQARKLQLKDIIVEFETWTLKELDYSLEATNMEKFAKLFAKDAEIYTPIVFREFSTDKVLITEFIEGPMIKALLHHLHDSISDEYVYGGTVYSKRIIMDLFVHNVFKQVFREGFIHGDPHPSNLIMKSSTVISFIDFGIMTYVTQEQLQLFKEVAFSLVTGDWEKFIEGMIQFDQEEGVESKEKIRAELIRVVHKLQTSLVESYSPTVAFTEAVYICSQLGVQFPTYIILLGKTLSIYDGMLQLVDPTVNVLELVKPMFEDDQMDQALHMFSKDEMEKDLFKIYKNISKFKDFAFEIPQETVDFMKEIRKEGIKVKVQESASEVQKQKNDAVQAKVDSLLILTVINTIAYVVIQLAEVSTTILGVEITTLYILSYLITVATLYWLIWRSK